MPFYAEGISEEASAVRVLREISERQAEPVVDKTKERYAVEKDPESINCKESKASSRRRTALGLAG